LKVPEDNVVWKALKRLIVSEGESIKPLELETLLTALVGGQSVDDESMMTAKIFSAQILGFENGSNV
jgi:hypothetical protein